MALALWIAGGWVVLVCCGTWALQIALWLVEAALRLICGLAVFLFGLVSLLALALLDRDELRRARADQAVASALARERWS